MATIDSRKRVGSSGGKPTKPRVNLAEFPEELLLRIFRCVHDTPIPDSKLSFPDKAWTCYSVGTRAIQNIRLTCRDFNRISSEFLVKFVVVDVSSESLARFQAIMQHPLIRKGVCMVRVRLQVYDWVLTQSLTRYTMEARYSTRRREVRVARLATHSGVRWPEDTPIAIPEQNEGLIAALKPAYMDYKQRYQAQHSLPKRQFVADLADAMMVSWKPLRIEITDRNDFDDRHWQSSSKATRKRLVDLIARPRASSWEELNAVAYGQDRSFAFMMPPLLEAFADDRIHIEDLRFDITMTNPTDRLIFAGMDRRPIQRAMRNLKKFTYISGCPSVTGDGKELSTVLYNCLPPDSLQTLALQLVEFKPRHHLPKLTKITLTRVPINSKTLSTLLQPLEPHSVGISLNDCSASKGSWSKVLDLLRSKQRWATLHGQRGWNGDGDWIPIFGELSFWAGPIALGVDNAEKYIRGVCDTNPLQADAESSDEENADYTQI